ncbi:helix-turn-helix domain-containing protein [Aquimarina sp. M1]
MISIAVNSLPIADIMNDLSKAFDTSYTESCGFYVLTIPKNFGKGKISGINFDSGMGIIQYNCTFIEDVEFKFTVNDVHPLKFLYCVEGKIQHAFENIDEHHNIKRFQEAIVASEQHNGHILRFDAGKHIAINSLEITRRKFRNRIQCDLVTFDESLQELFNDENAENLFYHEGYYSLRMADLFHRIQEFKEKNVLKNLFLEGVAYQMLTEQIVQYEDDIDEDTTKNVLRQAEVVQIEQAAQIIKEDLANLTGIDEIATTVGLNNSKLQEGFHLLYNCSVNQYIHATRINLIKDLILNTEYTISEIVYLVGLSSKSYLSKIFKDEYGTSPSEYRKQFFSTIEEKKKQLDTSTDI